DVEVVGAPVAHHAAGVVTDESPAAGIGAGAAFGVVRGPGGGAEPAVPVDAGRNRFLFEEGGPGGAADGDVDGLEFADSLVADEFAGIGEVVVRALLRAGLEDAGVAVDGIRHGAGFADGVGEGLFTVDVFAGAASFDGDDGVPVFGDGD